MGRKSFQVREEAASSSEKTRLSGGITRLARPVDSTPNSDQHHASRLHRALP